MNPSLIKIRSAVDPLLSVTFADAGKKSESIVFKTFDSYRIGVGKCLLLVLRHVYSFFA